MPAVLASDVRRVARQRRIPVSRALVSLAEQGLQVEAEAKERLGVAYARFLTENDSECKGAAGKELIRAIFGKDSIAEASVR
jgi:hypothetical protein